jgi:hypothetical protein
MAEIKSLSATDASNTARFPENMAPSAVNDGARALEGMLARRTKDTDGSLASTGSSNAYALAINQTDFAASSTYDGYMLAFQANHSCTGAATLNVTPSGASAVGAKAIKKHNDVALASGDIESGAVVVVCYDNSADVFQLISPLGNASLADPMTTRGDIIVRNSSNVSARLAVGAADTALVSDGTDVGYTAIVKQGLHTIFVPAGAMRPTTSGGCAALAATETTAGQPDLIGFAFDASSDEAAQFQIAMPKSWNEGTITFRAYWWSTAADTDGVAWALQGVACADGDTADVAYGTAVVVTDAAQSTSEDVYITDVSGAVTVAGSPAAGELCFFRVFRDVSDVADTAAEDCILLGIDILFTIAAGNDA